MLTGPQPASIGDANPYPRAASRTQGAGAGSASFSLPPATGAGPQIPLEVVHALDRAAKVANDLSARQLSVHFERGPSDHVSVQVLGPGGRVIRELAPAHALDLLSGEVPGQLLNEIGAR